MIPSHCRRKITYWRNARREVPHILFEPHEPVRPISFFVVVSDHHHLPQGCWFVYGPRRLRWRVGISTRSDFLRICRCGFTPAKLSSNPRPWAKLWTDKGIARENWLKPVVLVVLGVSWGGISTTTTTMRMMKRVLKITLVRTMPLRLRLYFDTFQRWTRRYFVLRITCCWFFKSILV